jgi:glycosyltransferase involved in cell wall biosynthesis
MAAGCAVVATNLPGISEFIENKNQGLLFPPGDTQTLQSLLKKLVSDPDLTRQLGAEARIKIKNMDLTWDRCAKDYINQYIASLNSWPHN